jgi:hypothetical protein
LLNQNNGQLNIANSSLSYYSDDTSSNTTNSSEIYQTVYPTSIPTLAPTYPEGSPTPEPSLSPTVLPSSIPSSRPTETPSVPSNIPSSCPTSQPSSQPSSIPSSIPSSYPSTSQPTGYLGPRFNYETGIVIVGLTVSDMEIELNRFIFIKSQEELIKKVTLENYVVVDIISISELMRRYLINDDRRKLAALPTLQPTSMPTNQGGELLITTKVTLETTGDNCVESIETATICIEEYETLITNAVLNGTFNEILIQKAIDYNSSIISSSRLIPSSFTQSEPELELDVRVPTFVPTFVPTKTYYIPPFTIYIGILLILLVLLCIYNCCFVKSVNKQKIFDMMNEEKLEDELKLAAIQEGFDPFDEDDNTSVFGGSQTVNSYSQQSQQTGFTFK